MAEESGRGHRTGRSPLNPTANWTRSGSPHRPAAAAAADGDLTASLVEIRSEVLGVSVGPDDDFFEPGDVTGDGSTHGATAGGDWERTVAAQARAYLRAGRGGLVELGGDTTTCLSVLVRTHASRPRMLIFGAVDFAGALSEIGRFLG